MIKVLPVGFSFQTSIYCLLKTSRSWQKWNLQFKKLMTVLWSPEVPNVCKTLADLREQRQVTEPFEKLSGSLVQVPDTVF